MEPAAGSSPSLSQSVAFFAGGQLKRIDVAGGFVQNLADAPLNTRGGAWNAAGTILFTRSATEPLYRVPGRIRDPPLLTSGLDSATAG